MNDLRIIIARLGWPSKSVRWWAIQELSGRLGEPTTRSETELLLLQLLRSRKLEAEVVEVLCIFWMAVKMLGYHPINEIGESVLLPSPLSDLLMQDMGLTLHRDNRGLEEVTPDFEIPEDFEGVQGVELPRIFRTSMMQLQTHTNLPFVRQMAFEWTKNRLAYPDAPYQGDPGHFLRPLGAGFIGHLSVRAALRAISAYLRTLAVARSFWGMPTKLVDDRSLLALPIHPGLAFLRPLRPQWFPESTEFDGDIKSIETSLRALVARVEEACPGDELIAFNSPIVMTMERCVELSLVRWSQADGGNIDDTDLATHLRDFQLHGRVRSNQAADPLSTTTSLDSNSVEQLKDQESRSWPMAGILDFDRIGYLQHDLYPSRIFLPTLADHGGSEFAPHDGKLQVKQADKIVADLTYWNAGWSPSKPRPFGGNCGTSLVSRGIDYRAVAGSSCIPSRSFYLWHLRELSRKGSIGDFSETLTSGVMFV